MANIKKHDCHKPVSVSFISLILLYHFMSFIYLRSFQNSVHSHSFRAAHLLSNHSYNSYFSSFSLPYYVQFSGNSPLPSSLLPFYHFRFLFRHSRAGENPAIKKTKIKTKKLNIFYSAHFSIEK